MALSRKDRETAAQVAGLLRTSSRVYVVTGAGVSADSGLPTYRGIGGLYTGGGTDEGIPIETAISGPMMARNPALPWKYLAQIERACRGARPNRAHEIIAAMQDRFDVWVLTQNIDGLHHAAGSRQVIDIHGDLRRLYCTACGRREEVDDYSSLGALPPACPDCGALVRPDVVLFGERLSSVKYDAMIGVWEESFDIVFSVGTTSVFAYIAQPVLYARRFGVPTVEINPGGSHVSHLVDYRIEAGAAETMELIWSMYNGGDEADRD